MSRRDDVVLLPRPQEWHFQSCPLIHCALISLNPTLSRRLTPGSKVFMQVGIRTIRRHCYREDLLQEL